MALAEDSRLLRSFLRDLVGVDPPRGAELHVEEQAMPGELSASEEEAERRGLPDVWVHDDGAWSVLIETKLTARLTADQLRRHLATARRRGFDDVTVVALTAKPETIRLPSDSRAVIWREVYSWLRRHESRSDWARRVRDYLEVVEGRMSEREDSFDGSLTEFTGFPFGSDRPWSYGEAKRVLRLAMGELRKRGDLRRQLRMDPKAAGRTAITGRDTNSVWDFLSLEGARGARQHTAYPHLTLSVQTDKVWAHVTCPNAFRRRLGRRRPDHDDLSEALLRVERAMRAVVRKASGASPRALGLQRHYASQRSEPTVDAVIDFDLRTIAGSRGTKAKVKPQPAWLDAVHAAMQDRKSNFQLAVGMAIPYRRCPVAGTKAALDVVAGSWIACKPLLTLLTEQ